MIEYLHSDVYFFDMNTLPNQTSQDLPVMPQSVSSTGMGKEVELQAQVSNSESVTHSEQLSQVELPKEVTAIGVTISPTTVVLPNVVQHAGVTAINPVVSPLNISSTIVLPLSDDQIAKGLHESLLSSVRWLAQWCERRLKQIVLYARPSI